MSKVLLGTLVVAMLALTGVVAYNTLNPPCCGTGPTPVTCDDDSSCCPMSRTVSCPLSPTETSGCKEGATPTAAKPSCCQDAPSAATAIGAKKD